MKRSLTVDQLIDATAFAVKTFWHNILFFLGLMFVWALLLFVGFFLAIILSGLLTLCIAWLASVIHGIPLSAQPEPSFALMATFIGSTIAMTLSSIFLLTLGINRIALDFYDTKTSSFKRLFACSHIMIRGTFGYIIYYGAVVLGLVLFVLPGFYLALRWYFFPQILVDTNCSLRQAFARSKTLTKGIKLPLLGFMILVCALNAASTTFLGIGWLVILPLTLLATIYIYRTLQEKKA